MTRCQSCELVAPTQKESLSGDDQRIGPLLDQTCEGSVDFALGVGALDQQFAPDGAAASKSVVSVSVFGLVGSARKPIAAAAGTRSRNNSKRFWLAVEAIIIPVLDVLREIRSSFRATSFTEIAKMVERVECPTFQRLSQFIRSHFRRKVRVDDDIADLFSAFDNR
jgi:hypothetical protein